MAAPRTPPGRDLALDTLGDGRPVDVVLMDDLRVGDAPIRDPHRHDYHEIIWLREGCGEHLVDGVPQEISPGTITIVGRGQVHQFLGASAMRGAILRFRDELVAGGAQRIAAGWLLTGACGRTIPVPAGERARLEGVLRTILAELRRPQDTYSADLQGNLIAIVLLWLERWYDGAHVERGEPDDAGVGLQRRFTTLLERDFARYHDAGHYADALGVPRTALARTLVALTGQTTKDLILDRVMLEAARLLRFTDRSIGEIAYAVGFGDQLYFSRAFKRRLGAAPMAYREAARGR